MLKIATPKLVIYELLSGTFVHDKETGKFYSIPDRPRGVSSVVWALTTVKKPEAVELTPAQFQNYIRGAA